MNPSQKLYLRISAIMMCSLSALSCKDAYEKPVISKEIEICGDLNHKVRLLSKFSNLNNLSFVYGTNPSDFQGQVTFRLIHDDFEILVYNHSSPRIFDLDLYSSDDGEVSLGKNAYRKLEVEINNSCRRDSED